MLFFFSPSMLHPLLCATRNLLAALSFSSFTPTLVLINYFSALWSDPHGLRQTSTAALSSRGSLSACWCEGGRPETLSWGVQHLCKPTAGAIQTRTSHIIRLKSQAFTATNLSKIHTCLFLMELQHFTFTWVKFQLACFSITWTLWSNTSAT